MRLSPAVARLRTAALISGAALSLTVTGPAVLGLASPVSAAPIAATDQNAPVADDKAPPAGAHLLTSAAGAGGAGTSGTKGTGELNATSSPAGTARSASPFAQTVIGADGRTRVNPTTTYPTSAIVQISRTSSTGTFGCTGWLYGTNIIATAGHCVHPGGGGDGGGGNGFYPRANYTITPARNGATNPFGTCTATQLLSVNGWTVSGNEGNDYGAIRLSCNAGTNTGTFGLWWQSASLNGTATTVSGYPCDKTFGEQWRHAGLSVTATETEQVFYQNDTAGCQSGSPVYQNRAAGSAFCTGQCVMAIHAYGLHGSSPHSTNNHGTRITEAVFNNLITWRG